MKKIMALVFLFSCISSYAQTNDQLLQKPQEVRIKNWMKSSFLLPENFWEGEKKEEIIKQVGHQEFEKIKVYSDYHNIPPEMLLYDFKADAKKDTVAYKEKLNKLKVYRIATWRHMNGGKYWGQYSVICVPYVENKNWDSMAKWDTVYFVIADSFLEVI